MAARSIRMAISPRLAAMTLLKGQRWARLLGEGAMDSIAAATFAGMTSRSSLASVRICSSACVEMVWLAGTS